MDKPVSLSDSQHSFANEQAAERGFDSGEDYVRSLLDREQALKQLRDALLEGKNSPLEGPADEAFFDGLRQRILDRHAE